MLRKSVLLKPGARTKKSVKKSPVGVKKPKTVPPKLEKKLKPKVEIEKKEKLSEEVKELQNKFHIKASTAKKAVEAVVTLTSENPKLKNKLLDDQFPIFLQINSIKVPKTHTKIVRIPLKHPILTQDSDICLIVPDVKGIPNKNHEEHVEHYEQILRKKDVTNIKKIMTFHEFRTEFETFEQRRGLVELYDSFLVDGRISGKTVKKCGKIFYQKRKVPTAVKLQASKLKDHINQALNKTPLYIHGKSDSFMVQIAHSGMNTKQSVENLFYTLKELDKQFPGGFNNVRSLNLTSVRGITIPIYVTLKNQTEVVLPKEVKSKNVVETVTGEITMKMNSGVVVKPTGEIKLYRLGKKRENKGQEIHSDQQEENDISQEKTNRKRKLEKTSGIAKNLEVQVVKKKKKENKQQVILKKSTAADRKSKSKKKSGKK